MVSPPRMIVCVAGVIAADPTVRTIEVAVGAALLAMADGERTIGEGEVTNPLAYRMTIVPVAGMLPDAVVDVTVADRLVAPVTRDAAGT
jgi:hypothetical protein